MRATCLLCCFAVAGALGCAGRDVRQEPETRLAPRASAAPATKPSPAPVAQEPSRPPEPVAAPAAAVDRGQQPPTGRPCRIHFRRDAMGLAAQAPLAIRDSEIPGRTTHKAGTLDQVTDEWVVLRSDGRLWWIPRAVILTIELEPEQ